MAADPRLGRRERDIAACLIEAVAAPGGALPPLRSTAAVDAFDALLAAAPALHRRGLRALLLAIELAPRFTGAGARLRQLSPQQRAPAVRALLARPGGKPFEALCALAKLAYYGEDHVMRVLGYDADAVLARARAVRVAEARW